MRRLREEELPIYLLPAKTTQHINQIQAAAHNPTYQPLPLNVVIKAIQHTSFHGNIHIFIHNIVKLELKRVA